MQLNGSSGTMGGDTPVAESISAAEDARMLTEDELDAVTGGGPMPMVQVSF